MSYKDCSRGDPLLPATIALTLLMIPGRGGGKDQGYANLDYGDGGRADCVCAYTAQSPLPASCSRLFQYGRFIASARYFYVSPDFQTSRTRSVAARYRT